MATPFQIITYKQFYSYEDVRLSGIVDESDTQLVSELSGLTNDEVKYLQNNYSLFSKYYK
jgi:hypothetical protein